MSVAITEPGIVHGLPEAAYHADTGSLSHSGARDILHAPALYRWRRDHPQPPTPAMELGTVVHTLILGAGPAHEVVDGGRGVTERREAARAAGRVPLSADDAEQAEAMAAAVLGHPQAAEFLALAPNREVSAYAPDALTGVLMRCRFDALAPHYGLDVKTVREGSVRDFGRHAFTYGYHQQAAWYSDVMAALGRPLDAFVFVLVEKTPPYLVAVRELDEAFVALGRSTNRRAIDTYAACVADDDWPGYSPYEYVSAPPWAREE